MKTIEEINQRNVKKILSEKKIPDFFTGDVVKVGVIIKEGKKARIQYFEGICIAKKNRDINSSFTVRKISFGEGVERTFPLYGTVIDSIKVIRSGKVRRGKLYYLRDRTGKSARIAEKIRKKIVIDIDVKPEIVNEENLAPVTKKLEAEAIPRLGPKGIFPNVDFYSGLVYRKLGIPRDLFTPIFAISRVAGWLAHWREQLGANRIFRPSQIYTGSAPRDWINLENRK